MLLANFPELVATNLFDAEKNVDGNAKGSTFSLVDKSKPFRFEVNVAHLGGVSLVAAACDVPCVLSWTAANFTRSFFQISGRSTLSFDNRTVNTHSRTSGCLVPPGSRMRLNTGSSYQSITMRLDQRALAEKLSALIGEDIEYPSFDYYAEQSPSRALALRLSTLELAREIDRVGSTLTAPVLMEFAQSVIIRFLLYSKHSYSQRLIRAVASPSQRQLQLIVDYIHEHWDKPLEMSDLVKASGIGARTIFRLFSKERGDSPAALVRLVRLQHARAKLLSGTPDETVIAVALKCGFHSLGHFAREYRTAFGELPSETLRDS